MEVSSNEKLFDKSFRELFPDVLLSSFRYGNEKRVNYSHYMLPSENAKLMRSQYYYGGANNLCHFTSIEAALSIVESRSIRLYNLHALNDPREFNYAANVMKLSEEEKLESRSNLFILSLCEKSIFEKRTSKQFNLWRQYGRDGMGCAIEFSFSRNAPKNWENYYLSPIIYGNKEREKISQLYLTMSKINRDEKVIGIDLNQLLCFHKSLLYKDEQEVRLLFDCRPKKAYGTPIFRDKNNRRISPILRTDLLKIASVEKIGKYVELPLYRERSKIISNEIPRPRIEKIIIGYRNKENFELISNEINERIVEKLGYSVHVELSNLSSIFW